MRRGAALVMWLGAATATAALASCGLHPGGAGITTDGPAGQATSEGRFVATAAAYDAAFRDVVLVGLVEMGTHATLETWVWDGGGWTQRHPATSPSPRQTTLVEDPVTHHVLLLGGTFNPPAPPPSPTTCPITEISGYPDGTWTFDGRRWAHVSAQPGPETNRIVFDPRNQRMLGYVGHHGDPSVGRRAAGPSRRRRPSTAKAGCPSPVASRNPRRP
jgi:hypothetical protein